MRIAIAQVGHDHFDLLAWFAARGFFDDEASIFRAAHRGGDGCAPYPSAALRTPATPSWLIRWPFASTASAIALSGFP